MAAAPTEAVATAVTAAAAAAAGVAAGREEPVSENGDAGCVGRGAVGVGHRRGKGLAIGGTSTGPAGGGGGGGSGGKGSLGAIRG